MIRYFPNIYSDELLYSAFCRYYKNTKERSCKTTLKELIPKDNPLAIMQFPSNIELFIKQFNNINYYSAEDIIFRFTMLPLYYPFLDIDRQQYAINNMKGNNGKGICMKLGVMASSLKALRFLKFCPECLKEDKLRYGEVYWHRSHNVEKVYLCHKHNIRLEQFCNVCNSPIATKNKFKLTPLMTECENGHDITNQRLPIKNRMCYMEEHIKISKAVEFLLNSNLREFNIEKVFNRYINLLGKRGFLTISGRFKMKELKQQFVSYYEEGFLKELGLSIDLNSNYSWLEELFHKRKKMTHPIKHILVINFLVDNFTEFFLDYNIELKPFEVGPWPCLNPIANHYMEHVIEDYEINYDGKSKEIVGTFKCKCGFIYTRRLTSDEDNNTYKKTKIKEFGWLWGNKLKETILSEGGSLRHIAKIMKADPMTIKKYASKLGLKPTWNEVEKNANIRLDKNSNSFNYDKHRIKDEYKNRLLDYLSKNQVSKTQLRKKFKKEYIWLYRNDKELLIELLNKCNKYTGSMSNKKVDWNERDNMIYSLIKDDIKKILESEKPIRITISRLGNDIGYISLLEKHLDKLPRTKKLLEENIESVEQFQIRRVNKVIDEMIFDDLDIKEWKVYRKAGLRKNCSKKVKEEIKKGEL